VYAVIQEGFIAAAEQRICWFIFNSSRFFREIYLLQNFGGNII